MYRGEAGSRLLRSVPPGCFSGCPRDGVAQRRGTDPGVLRRLPARGEPPADPLTPFARNSSPAAGASSVCHRRPSEEGCPLCSPTSSTPQEVWCPNSPWGHARWHPCASPGTRTSSAPAHACHCTAGPGHGPGMCHTLGCSLQSGAGMGGGGGQGQMYPHTRPMVLSAPSDPRPGLGGDKDTVPLHTPTAEEAGAAQWAPVPHSWCQHPPSCPQLGRLGVGGGREQLPTRRMGGIKPDVVSLPAAQPGALAALQPGEGRAGTGAQHHPPPLGQGQAFPLPTHPTPHPPPFSPITHITGQLGGGHIGSQSPTLEDGAA